MIKRKIIKEMPNIMTGFAVFGVASTTILAVEATKAAVRLIDIHEPKTKKEIIKLVWKLYIPTGMSMVLTSSCIIAANHIQAKRNAALAGLYAIAERGLAEYQAKVIETIGEKKEQLIRDGLAQDRLDKDPVDGKQVILTGKGEYMCYDSLSGRYFKSEVETIRRVQNDFNREMLTDMYKTVNDLYDELGLEGTEMGRNTGWTVERGLLDIRFAAKIASNGEPCIVLEYKIEPLHL